jgi:glyoxylase-like metal-dependent hydrolase (beta-lactamase superfamily II)
MNRRDLLKQSVFIAGSAFNIPVLTESSFLSKLSSTPTAPASLQLQIGDLETTVFFDGVVSLPSYQPVFAPEVPPDELRQQLQKLHMPIQMAEAGINVLLIRKGGRIILMDTGFGHLNPNAGKLVPALQALGVQPRDVTDIIITHAHIDHVGGILDADDHPVFPSAVYHIAKKEYEFWMSANPDFSRSKGDSANAAFSISFARKVLGAVKSKLNIFEYGQELFSCIIPELAEGHTPGHTMFTIYSGNKSLQHIVDTFHLPLLVSHPHWGCQWDTDFDKAVATRRKIVRQGAEQGTLFLSCHLPWPGLGYIDKAGEDYYWMIYPGSSPNKITL